ncbi:MAG: WG repeat-containing protein, partial [Bacteroidia bacterium]|nr:WG repeat-containing protein [Bacteroidia bacterium]
PQYLAIKYLEQNKQFIFQDSTLYGICSMNGEILIDANFNKIVPHDSLYLLHLADKRGVFDKNGTTILPLEYKEISFNSDFIIGLEENGTQSVYKRNGELIFKGYYNRIQYLTDNYFSVTQDKKEYLINADNAIVYDSLARYYNVFNTNSISIAGINGMGLFSTEQNRMLLEPDYTSIWSQVNSTNLIANKNGLQALFDSNGQAITEHKYQFISTFNSAGLCKVRSNGWGIISSDGREILPCKYAYLAIGEDGIIKGKYGSTISLYEFNQNFQLIDSVQFTNAKTLNLGGKVTMTAEEGVVRNQSPSSLWYQNEKGLWGLKDSNNQVFIKPSINEIKKIGGTNYVLCTFYQKKVLRLGKGTTLTSRKLYALVDEIRFKKMTPSNTLYIDTANLRNDKLRVFRVMLNNGYFASVRKRDGRMLRYQSKYIGEFNEGYAKIFVGTQIFALTSKPVFVSISQVRTFARDFGFQPGLSRWRKTYYLEGIGYWAYIGPDGRYIMPLTDFKKRDYRGAKNFVNGRAIVMTKDSTYGLVNTKGDYILNPFYSKIEYLEYTNDSLLLTEVYKPRYGYVTDKGETISQPQFSLANNFSEGFAWAHFDGKTVLISRNGTIKELDGKAKTTSFSSGVAGIAYQYKYAIVDTTLNQNSDFIYSKVGNCTEGLLPLKRRGKYGYADENGVFILPAKYSKAESFSNGVALVRFKTIRNRNYYGYINQEGKFVISPKYTRATSMNTNGFAEVKKGSRKGILNSQGKKIVPVKYKRVYERENFFVATNNLKTTVYNQQGKKIKSIRGKARNGYSDGLLVLYRSGKFGAFDTKGKKVLPFKYRGLKPFENGVSASQSGKTCYIISIERDTLAILEGRAIGGFVDGLLLLKQRDGYIFVNRFGQNTFQKQFKEAEPFVDGYALVRENAKFGLLDNKGFYRVLPEYDQVKQPVNGVSIVAQNYLVGVCDLNSNYLIAPECTDIKYDRNSEVFQYSYKNQYGYFDKSGKVIWKVSN